MESLFDELKRYVAFDGTDENALRALHSGCAPEFERISDIFYRRILDHSEAKKALEGGESQVGRLKITLIEWMDSLLRGPWDEAYYERRARIGRVHVRISLPQHYMFGAMNVLRQELVKVIDRIEHDEEKQRVARLALGKILDLELAIMLHTYREDLIAQQSRNERLATFGQLVGSIGHELRNPLGVIESSLYILRGRVGGDERGSKHIQRIDEQLHIANDIISALLDMIRDRPLVRERVHLGSVLDGVLEAVRRPPGVELVVDGIGALPDVEGDAGRLRQVLLNLVENAVHAVGDQGHIWVRGSEGDSAVAIAVEDDGPGVDAATRRRLFEPLVTTKAKGIGLGLALIKRILERHRGTITYEDRPGGGARFVVTLPLGDAHA